MDASSDPQVSVVIPNFNGLTWLPECLDSLAAQEFAPFEVIVVDNGSRDGSRDYLSRQDGIRVVLLPGNRGFSGGCNAGIRECKGTFIALLNNDAVASPNWLSALVEAARRHPEADSFAGPVLRKERPEIIDSAGDVYSIAGSAKKRYEGRPFEGMNPSEIRMFGAGACAALYTRRFFEKVGLFDEDFFCYFEDVDLAFRGVLKGLSSVFVPEALVFHRVSSTYGEASSFVTYHNSRNLEWVYWKNMPGFLMIKYALPAMALRLLALAFWGRKGRLAPFLRGKKDAMSALGQVWIKRKAIQQSRILPIRKLDRMLERKWLSLHLQGRSVSLSKERKP